MRALVMFLACVAASCGGAGIAASARSTPTATNREARPEAPPDPAEDAWSRRMQPEDTARAIELWSQRVVVDENDAAAWTRLAEAHHFAATVHAPDAPTVIEHARAGMLAAERALELLSPEAVPPLYWRTRNQIVLAAAEGYAQTLLMDDEVTRALLTCERLQPDYDHFGAVMLLAARSAHPIDPAQRDLAAARQRFDRVLAVDSTFMPHHVAFAESYAIIASDRTLFQQQLESVRDVPLTEAAAAEEQLAHARAQQLLQQMDDLFE